jgi:hypothetical protein
MYTFTVKRVLMIIVILISLTKSRYLRKGAGHLIHGS